ncbi:MAG: CehA/McbA family metallohydrolase [Alphaproteobacteria bacterium]|nr:CehA/McbA family metallohydrolase [Alphaproteobacteria bacterium]
MLLSLLLACAGGAGPSGDSASTDSASSDSASTGDDGAWVPALAGEWTGGDLHVHTSTGSNDTDGVSFVDDQAAAARDRGLDWLVFTDHSNSAGSMDCETGDVEDCPNQGPEFPARDAVDAWSGDMTLAVGVELSPVAALDGGDPRGHVLCVPRPGDPFADVDDAFVDRPTGDVTGGAGVAWCQDRGGFAVVAHPYNIARWIAYDWTADAYDGIEVFNGGGGGFDGFDRQGVDAWLCDLAQQRPVVAVGGSDCHRATTEGPPPGLLDQAVGWPTTWVRAASTGRDDVLAALAAGRVTVSEPGVRLQVEASTGGPWVGPGESLAAGTLTLRLHGETDVSGTHLQVLHVAAGACTDDPRWTTGGVPTVAPTVLHDEAVTAGAFDQTLTLAPGAGALVVRLWSDDAAEWRGMALANPVWLQ